MLANETLRTYSRQIAIPSIGITGQESLEQANVVVVGAGGLGCPALIYLAAAGVGSMTIIDPDEVEASNLHRQVLFGPNEVGTPKAIAAVKRLREQGYGGNIVAKVDRITSANGSRLLAGAQLVLDCTDNFDARYAISDAALREKINHVWGAVYRLEGSSATFPPDDTLNYRAQFPVEPPPELSPTCETGGVLGAVCGVVGSMMAASAVASITGARQHSEEVILQTYDAASASVQSHKLYRVDKIKHIIETTEAAIPEIGLEVFTSRGTLKDASAVLIDVREPHELAIYSIPNSRSLPLGRLAAIDSEMASGLPEDMEAPILTICKSGYRSRIAARLIAELGYTNVRSISGGAQEYARQFLPDISPEY